MYQFANESVLLEYARQFAGFSLEQIAQKHNLTMPAHNLYAKGWAGSLFEYLLGTTAGNQAKPDFDYLGVELKTLPISLKAQPLETTYVSTVPLDTIIGATWEHSEVFSKLKRVLWLPLIGERGGLITKRIVGTAFLWSPTEQQECQLKQDWQELTDIIAMQGLETLSTTLGTYLHIRPKAAHGAIRTQGVNAKGNKQAFLPRGFYLRTQFTKVILASVF